MATARFDMRIDQELKAKAAKAAALIGASSLTDYVTRLIDEDATRVLAEHERFSVSNDVFDRFISACENASGPNDALRKAAERTDKLGIK